MKMTNRWLAAILCGGVSSIVLSAQNSYPPSRLRAATQLTLPDVKITEAVAVPAATTGAIQAAHCRVTGVIGTEIQFSLLLPDDWNRKFLMGGGGGFVGTVQNQAQATVNAGYATAGTDTGPPGSGDRRELGAEQPRAAAELRLPRGAPHRRNRRRRFCAATTARPRRARTSPAARTAAARR